MMKKIVRWIIKKVDLDVQLDADILTITVKFQGMKIWTWTVPLFKHIDERGMPQSEVRYGKT